MAVCLEPSAEAGELESVSRSHRGTGGRLLSHHESSSESPGASWDRQPIKSRGVINMYKEKTKAEHIGKKQPHEKQDQSFEGERTETIKIGQKVIPFDSPPKPGSTAIYSILVRFVKLPFSPSVLLFCSPPPVVYAYTQEEPFLSCCPFGFPECFCYCSTSVCLPCSLRELTSNSRGQKSQRSSESF